MPRYLVETYVPRTDADAARAAGRRARAAARQLSREGKSVRYVRTTFLPRDETCFHIFEAGSEQDARNAAARAGIQPERVLEATNFEATRVQLARSARGTRDARQRT